MDMLDTIISIGIGIGRLNNFELVNVKNGVISVNFNFKLMVC